MPNLKSLLIQIRTSFWFLPGLMVFLCASLAMALIEVDSFNSFEFVNRWPRLFGAGAEGSREMLSTIAGSVMTMMGVTFSMTLVALALTSSQYTSRILRNFIRNRATQFVLGSFAGIYTYCLIVLRTIRGESIDFVPSLSIVVGFLMALMGVGVLVFFIHHVASRIQASNIISSVAEETIQSMKTLFPASSDASGPGPSEAVNFNAQILARASGYIQTFDEERTFDLAKKFKGTIRIRYGIGEFVVRGTVLAEVGGGEVTDEIADEVVRAFSIQRYRTIEQDALFGIRQIVDIALKALSPGINDSTTAVVCVNYLTSILSFLSKKDIPSCTLYEGSNLRLVVRRPSFDTFAQECFSEITTAAAGNLKVLACQLDSLDALFFLNSEPRRRESRASVPARLP